MRERTPNIEGSSGDSDSGCNRYGGSAASPVARITRNAQCSSQSSRPIEARVLRMNCCSCCATTGFGHQVSEMM